MPFADCEETEIAPLGLRMELRHEGGERLLFAAGDASDSVYFVTQGAVDIVDRSEQPERLVASITEGHHFGELGVMTARPRQYGARSRPNTRLLRMTAADFKEVLATMPSVRKYFDRFVQAIQAMPRR
ncbi:MAG: cyclic nucleotide-binding domain-containing protein [Myxococcales bacterium]|nr:cyclic nucleotide-binding domain-containing protein [Myxococcales bacterium]